MLTGSCHCGKVKFDITGGITGFKHCHCHTCRKINGTIYGSSAVTPSKGFIIKEGEEHINHYLSSPNKIRAFCKLCGSHLFAYHLDDKSSYILRVGTIDNFPVIPLEAHIWVSHKAPWYDIPHNAPFYERGLDEISDEISIAS